MKKIKFIKYLLIVFPVIMLSCQDDDLADVGDLQDETSPTPFFSSSSLVEGTFDCEEILTDAMFSLPGTEETKLNVTKSYAEGKLTRTKLKKLKAVS